MCVQNSESQVDQDQDTPEYSDGDKHDSEPEQAVHYALHGFVPPLHLASYDAGRKVGAKGSGGLEVGSTAAVAGQGLRVLGVRFGLIWIEQGLQARPDPLPMRVTLERAAHA